MKDLLDWLDAQSNGVNSYHEFRGRAKTYRREHPQDAATVRLLTDLVDGFIWRYAEEPLPHDVGATAFETLKGFMRRAIDAKSQDPAHQLDLLNEIAQASLVEA